MKITLRIFFFWLALLMSGMPLLAQVSSPIVQDFQRIDKSRLPGSKIPLLNRTIRPTLPTAPAHVITKPQADPRARVAAATVETFYFSGTIVTWTVPANVYQLTIEAKGAAGASSEGGVIHPYAGGNGAIITGTVAVTPGQQLRILVGAKSNGGGGGSFVVTGSNPVQPLVIAGGGGAGGGSPSNTENFDTESKQGQAGTSGGAGGGTGGTNGNGGIIDGQGGGAGGGLYTDGASGFFGDGGGKAFVNGGQGGGSGGFGGGGTSIREVGSFNGFTGGGGGGYSGGGGGKFDPNKGSGVGGGGGSFNGGTIGVQINVTGANSGTGQVIFTYEPCVADASFTGLAGSYCADAAAVTLTPAVTGGTFSGPGVSANGTFTPANAGTGSSITYTLTETGPGCPDATSSQSVTVNPLPNASFTGLAGPYCADAAAVTLTPATAGGTFSGTGVSASGTFTPASAGSGTFAITYTVSVDGCSNSSSQNVTVKPVTNASFTGLAGPYCADAAAVTLTPTTAGGAFSGTGVSASGTFTPASAGSGTFAITYTVTQNGCINTSSQNVTVKPVTNASFTGLAGPYCANAAAVTLTPTTAGGTFSGPGVSASGTFTPSQAGTGGSITYTVTVDGCTSASSQSVVVNPVPTVDAGNDKSVILGFGGANSNCTSLTATPSGGSGGNYSFTWNPGGQTGSPITVCPQMTTTYTVTVTDGNGCTASDQVVVNVQDVRCGPKLNMVSICYYGVSQCVSEKIAKNYIKLGATLGACGSATTRTGYETEAPSLPLTLSLKAYPNPAVDAVTVEVLSRVAGVASFEVLDMSGRARQSRRQELTEGLNQVEFRLGGLPSGLYVIRAVDALGQQATVRVSKQ